MTALIVIGSVFAFFALLLCIPLGCRVKYSSDGFELFAYLGFIRIKLLPKNDKKSSNTDKEKKKKADKKKSKENKKSGDKKENSGIKKTFKNAIKGGGPVRFFTEVLKEVGKLLKKFGKRITINSLTLYYTSAGDDPFDTAMNYGKITAGMGAILPLIHTAFKVKKSDLWTFVDFNADKPTVYADAKITIILGGLLGAVFTFAFNSVKLVLESAAKAEDNSAAADEKKGGNNNGKASDQ